MEDAGNKEEANYTKRIVNTRFSKKIKIDRKKKLKKDIYIYIYMYIYMYIYIYMCKGTGLNSRQAPIPS